MRKRTGLRLKFNLVLVPIVAFGIAAMMSADYLHESVTLTRAHATHVAPAGAPAASRPMDPWTLPDAATRRSLEMHMIFGVILLILVVLGVNVTLQSLILRPIALITHRLASLERGQWRGPVAAAATGTDEIGVLCDGFQRLGPEIDALVGHVLHADRLAMLALLSKRLEVQIAPEVTKIGQAAGRLTSREHIDARAEGELLGRAAANILRAVHEYDAVFSAPSTPGRTTKEQAQV